MSGRHAWSKGTRPVRLERMVDSVILYGYSNNITVEEPSPLYCDRPGPVRRARGETIGRHTADGVILSFVTLTKRCFS
jgi:hypothetical protein